MFVDIIIFLLAYFTTWFIIATYLKNASIIDIGWGLGFVLIAWISLLKNTTLISIVLTALVTIWGLRLAYHIFKRNYKKEEDFRYAEFRKQWGKTYLVRSYFQLFLFQGFLMYLISLSFMYATTKNTIEITSLFIIGLIIWLIGFFFEVVGDYQLKEYIKSKKGQLITTGLWQYTRHPNYFGEATMWWGIFLIALSVNSPIITIISPLTITILVRFISGVPLLEKNMEKREGFEKYKKETNIFFPWFKKEVK